MPRSRMQAGLCLAIYVAAMCLEIPLAQAGGWPFGRKQKTPVEELADGIDDVEEALNEEGTVVAKVPDVWGESRLTKHRQEIEEQLAERIDQFQLLLNATLSRSDQAFLANAFALTSVMSGPARTGWTR